MKKIAIATLCLTSSLCIANATPANQKIFVSLKYLFGHIKYSDYLHQGVGSYTPYKLGDYAPNNYNGYEATISAPLRNQLYYSFSYYHEFEKTRDTGATTDSLAVNGLSVDLLYRIPVSKFITFSPVVGVNIANTDGKLVVKPTQTGAGTYDDHLDGTTVRPAIGFELDYQANSSYGWMLGAMYEPEYNNPDFKYLLSANAGVLYSF